MKYRDFVVGKAVVFLPWNRPCVVLSFRPHWYQRLRDRRRGYRSVLLGWPGNSNTVACDLTEIGQCEDGEVARRLEADYRMEHLSDAALNMAFRKGVG